VRPWSPHLPSTYGEVVVTPSGGDAVVRPILGRRNPYLLMLELFVERTRGESDWRIAAQQAVGDLELVDGIVEKWGA
jgi:hypothetical protein